MASPTTQEPNCFVCCCGCGCCCGCRCGGGRGVVEDDGAGDRSSSSSEEPFRRCSGCWQILATAQPAKASETATVVTAATTVHTFGCPDRYDDAALEDAVRPPPTKAKNSGGAMTDEVWLWWVVAARTIRVPLLFYTDINAFFFLPFSDSWLDAGATYPFPCLAVSTSVAGV